MLQMVGIVQGKASGHLLFPQNKHALGRLPISGSLSGCCQRTPGFVHMGKGSQSSEERLYDSETEFLP